MNVVNNKESSSKEELVKRTDVKDSPFTIIETNGKAFGAMGLYRITEPMDKAEDVKKELEKFTWNRLIQVVMILVKDEQIKKEA